MPKTGELREFNKTKGEWIVPINQPLRRLLVKLKLSSPDDRVVRPIEHGCKDVAHIAKIFAMDARRANVKIIRFHDLRHTFASQYMQNGGDIFSLSEIFGHKKIEMTQRYAHFGLIPLKCGEQCVKVRK